MVAKKNILSVSSIITGHREVTEQAKRNCLIMGKAIPVWPTAWMLSPPCCSCYFEIPPPSIICASWESQGMREWQNTFCRSSTTKQMEILILWKKDGEMFYFSIYNYVELHFACHSNIYFDFVVYLTFGNFFSFFFCLLHLPLTIQFTPNPSHSHPHPNVFTPVLFWCTTLLLSISIMWKLFPCLTNGLSTFFHSNCIFGPLNWQHRQWVNLLHIVLVGKWVEILAPRTVPVNWAQSWWMLF